jgi:poly-gamma-glutamate synthesis protein (capsule biosynthesis protein)
MTEDVVWASWREGCPLHFSELSLLTLSYWNFDGQVASGQLAINSAVAPDVITAFEGLFATGFPIERIELVDEYGGDDKAAMAANVTSGFNCRFVDGTDRWSNHAFGLAVDINPLINPWAREGNVLPVEGEPYADRTLPTLGMINVGDEAIAIFEEVGWRWGGVWQSADYMHFSKPGN